MRVVVTGGSGLLGRSVCQNLRKDGHEVTGTAHSRATKDLTKIDLTDFDALTSFLDASNCQVIVHTAAERRPDVVERSPEVSHRLNVEVPERIAKWCAERSDASSPILINISTDYVFDGTKPPYTVDDAPNPLNAYGKSKWEGEKAVRHAGKANKSTSLRVPVLYGRTESNDESAVNILLDAILPGAKSKKMDANAVRYPTNVDDVAKVISQIIEKGAKGTDLPPTLHFSAMEAMTKYDMCLVMARCLRAAGEDTQTDHLIPEYEVDPNAATSRPRHCKLDLSVTQKLGIDTTCLSFETWWRSYFEEYVAIVREKRAAEEAQLQRDRKEQQDRRRRQQQEEAERQRQIEHEERKQREEAEEQARKKAEEERELAAEEEQEQRRAADKIEADRKAQEQKEVHPADANIDAGGKEQSPRSQIPANTSTDVVRSSSSTGNPSIRGTISPNSPNPSFSSLQARPTPPATSGRGSPSPSDVSDVVQSVRAMSIVGNDQQQLNSSSERNSTNVLATSASTSATETGESVRGLEDQQAPPLSEIEPAKLQHDLSAETAEKAGFFPEALIHASDGASLGIAQSETSAAPHDGSSDDYGQPSPRIEKPSQHAPFAAGYGEVPFGLDDATPAEMSASQKSSEETARAVVGMDKQQASSTHASFQIRVGDPQKVGDPVTAHIVYTVRIKTDSPRFRTGQFSVLRRYSDFRWLHAALVHNNPGIFVPPVPEKVKIGRFAPDLVEARRHGLESCINKIANNPVLQFDDDLRIFLESQNFHADVKVRDQAKGPVPTPEQKTYFGWSTSFTGSTHKYHEIDEWFDEQNVFLDHLEMQLKSLVRIISLLAQQRKDMAAATSEMSHAMMMLSGSSLSRSLSTCFAGLGEVERRTFELLDVQSDCDIRDFGSTLYEFERMVGSARKAFSTRIDAWQTWQRLEDEAKKVRVKHEKVKRDTQPGSVQAHDGGRLQAALDELAAIESRCLDAKREFDVIGRRCKEEMDRFEWDRIASLHESCEQWLNGMIEKGQEIMLEWEQYAALLQRQTGQSIVLANNT